MSVSFDRTIESPCRTCENVHLNKDDCSKECIRLQAFQDAIVHHDERIIKDYGLRHGFGKD